MPRAWTLMAAGGIVMTAIYAYIRLVPFRAWPPPWRRRLAGGRAQHGPDPPLGGREPAAGPGGRGGGFPGLTRRPRRHGRRRLAQAPARSYQNIGGTYRNSLVRRNTAYIPPSHTGRDSRGSPITTRRKSHVQTHPAPGHARPVRPLRPGRPRRHGRPGQQLAGTARLSRTQDDLWRGLPPAPGSQRRAGRQDQRRAQVGPAQAGFEDRGGNAQHPTRDGGPHPQRRSDHARSHAGRAARRPRRFRSRSRLSIRPKPPRAPAIHGGWTWAWSRAAPASRN